MSTQDNTTPRPPGYLLAVAVSCTKWLCFEQTRLRCDSCGKPFCTQHSKITIDMQRLCCYCLAIGSEGAR